MRGDALPSPNGHGSPGPCSVCLSAPPPDNVSVFGVVWPVLCGFSFLRQTRALTQQTLQMSRYASSYNSQMAGKTHHSAPQDYGMRLMNGCPPTRLCPAFPLSAPLHPCSPTDSHGVSSTCRSHQQAMMAHAAASRRSMHEMVRAIINSNFMFAVTVWWLPSRTTHYMF